MSTPQWFFKKHQPDDITHNPLTGEHFSDSDGDWKPGESLVRECIQNSLDAAISEERPVIVRFQLSSRNAMNDDVASFWFGSLWRHLCAKDHQVDRVVRDLPADRPCAGQFIVVEDFGTRGLEGDITQSGLSGEKKDNRFHDFLRAEGVTGNAADATSGGSWGAGKSVFNRCSRINSFLALSTRESSRDTVLMGRAVLREHLIDGVQYKAFGLFGSKESAGDRLVLPIQDPRLIARFAGEFQITRPIDPERQDPAPGLSVVIPYPDPEITSDGIIEIVIRQYFYPILSGRLAVRIVDGGADSSDPIDINEGTIFDIAEQTQKPEILGLLKLSQWSMDPDASAQAYEVDRPPAGEAPLWDDARLRPDDPAYAGLCKRFEAGEPVAFRIPLTVCRNDGQAEQAFFSVYLQRDGEGAGYRPVFVRNKIVVPNARQRGIRGHSVFSLVTIDAGPLAILLKAAEPPAHTYWDHNTGNFKGVYKYGKQVIDYVVHAPRNLVNAISSRDSEPDFDALADLFPAPDREGKPRDKGKKRKGRRKSPTGPIDPPKSSPPAYRVDKLGSGGFVIVRANADKTDLPPLVRIKLGYATSKGDPIKKYHPADFDLSELSVGSQACRVIERSRNMLLFEPLSEDFRIEVTGFDPKRDLCIKPRAEQYPKGVEA